MEENSEKDLNNYTTNSQEFSIQRYVINIIVRITFFLLPIPLPTIHRETMYRLFPTISHFFSNQSDIHVYIPIGLTILLIGGILDILLPQKYIMGGKIATKAFNIGTLSWFEGLEFKVKVNVGASGKGIAIKDKKE